MRFLTVLSVCVALALARPVPQSRINIDDIENLKLEDLDVPTLDANAGERSNSGDTAGTKAVENAIQIEEALALAEAGCGGGIVEGDVCVAIDAKFQELLAEALGQDQDAEAQAAEADANAQADQQAQAGGKGKGKQNKQ